jgi:hypothetical protein
MLLAERPIQSVNEHLNDATNPGEDLFFTEPTKRYSRKASKVADQKLIEPSLKASAVETGTHPLPSGLFAPVICPIWSTNPISLGSTRLRCEM